MKYECNHEWTKYGNHWDCDCGMTRTLDPNKKPALMELGSEVGTLIQKGKPKRIPRGETPIEALIQTRKGIGERQLWRELFSQLDPDTNTVELIKKSQSLSLINTIIKLIHQKKEDA